MTVVPSAATESPESSQSQLPPMALNEVVGKSVGSVKNEVKQVKTNPMQQDDMFPSSLARHTRKKMQNTHSKIHIFCSTGMLALHCTPATQQGR